MWIKRWKGTISKDLHNENEHGEFLFSFLENVLIIFINLQCVRECMFWKRNAWKYMKLLHQKQCSKNSESHVNNLATNALNVCPTILWILDVVELGTHRIKYTRIQVLTDRNLPYNKIYNSVLMWENKSQRKPVFSHILCSGSRYINMIR